jgi:4-diphosphocytidyl-2-C-methyl-D-erythritol kinase
MPKATSYKVQSNAKINLALRITARRPDGYHDLSTLFQEIDLYDILEFTPADQYSISTSNLDLPVNEDNLCTRAYRTLERRAPNRQPYHILLTKNIPIGAGLGGGSSNAAAVLKFLNRAWQLNLAAAEMINIARSIGSDVPFYIRGKTQAGAGVGEILTPLVLSEDFAILLVLPPINISTAWAYRQFNPADCKPPYDFHELVSGGRIHWELFENQFEPVVFPAYPQLADLKRQIQRTGAIYAGLSGSGAAMFGVFPDQRAAEKAARQLPEWRCVAVRPVR